LPGLQRERAGPVAGDGEGRVGNRRCHRDHWCLACSGWRQVRPVD
jgi:hypothetical protein